MNESGEVLGLAVGIRLGGQALNFAIPNSKLKNLLATPRTELTPLDEIQIGRSAAENLIISVAGLAGIALTAWIATKLATRGRRKKETLVQRLVR